MSQLRKIAIFGVCAKDDPTVDTGHIANESTTQATGNIGRVILGKLNMAKRFDVRVISRKGSPAGLELGEDVVFVDYQSQTSFVEAIRGYHVVINALSVTAVREHHAILDAVLEAQVPRFYPATYGAPPPAAGRAISLLRDIPFMDTRRQIQHRVESAVIEGKVTYTTLRGGAWLETVLPLPVMFSLPQRKFFMHGYPDTEFSYGSRDLYAEALIKTLEMPEEETANRNFEVELFRVSQRRMLKLIQETFPTLEWEVVPADCEERYTKALKAMRSGKMDTAQHGALMSKICLDPDAAPLPARNDNDLLGVRRVTDEEVKQMLLQLQS